MIPALLLNWRVLGAVGALVAIGAAYLYVDHRAYQRGVDATTAVWTKREAAELAAANAEILRLQAEVLKKEHDAAETLAALAGLHQEEMAHVQAERDRFMDDLVAGRVRFYDPGSPARQAAACSVGPEVAAAAGGRDGQARAELSDEAARFLWRLAGEADDAVKALTLAQGTIEAYLQACR